MRIERWGNSLAIRLPKALVKAMNLAEGDEVELSVRGPAHVGVTVKPTKGAILEALREFEGRAPADFRFNRDEANER